MHCILGVLFSNGHRGLGAGLGVVTEWQTCHPLFPAYSPRRLGHLSARKGLLSFTPSLTVNGINLNYSEIDVQPITQVDKKVADGSPLAGANGGRPSPQTQKPAEKSLRPRLTRKALMKCCLVKWILTGTTSDGTGRGRH